MSALAEAAGLLEDGKTSQKHSVLFFSRPRDPRVGHTLNVLSPFISVLCHSN